MSTLEQLAYDDGRAERVLLERLRRGDRDALTALYQRYERRLYAFCHRMVGNPDDASDLVQETFLRVIRRLPELDIERLNLSAYLHTTARNLFYKQAERARRVQLEDRMEDVAPASEVLEEDPERALLLGAQQLEVRDANLRLAPRQRMVLALRELEDRSYAEIGEILDMNENAVAQLISRARIRLREELRLGQIDRSALAPETVRLLPQLVAYSDGQLKGEKLAAVEAALAESAECRAVVDAMGEASRRYRALVPAVPLALLGEEVARAAEAEGLVRRSDDGSGDGGGGRERASDHAVEQAASEPGVAAGAGAGVGGGPGDGVGRRPPKAARGRRRLLLGGAVAAVVLLAGGGVIVAAGGGDHGPAGGDVSAAAAALAPEGTSVSAAGEPTTTAPATVPATTELALLEGDGADGGPPPPDPTEGSGDTTLPVIPVVTTQQGTTTAPPAEPTTTGRTTPVRTEPPATTGGGNGSDPIAPTTTVTPPPPPPPTEAPPPPTTAAPPPPTTEPPPPTTEPPPPAAPNLVIGGLSGQRGTSTAPSVVWSVTVSNVGSGPAGPSTVTFTPSVGGPSSAQIGALAPGASQTVPFTTGCRGPSVSATAMADARFAVAESNEGDNSSSASASC